MTDITDYIKSFELTVNNGVRVPTPEEKEAGVFFWSFTPTFQADINLTVNPEDTYKLMELAGEKLIHMEYKGKYWFDVCNTADVVMTDLKIDEDGSINATCLSTNVINTTNRSILARFLRWLLRRQPKGLLWFRKA